ncbi:type II secretion system protein GspD [Zhongshania sp.]|uniref:type II secretion system protein GspD n=1 Tax=Zhongshania sp. TaxID=1971902 RepID=UPI00356ADB56
MQYPSYSMRSLCTAGVFLLSACTNIPVDAPRAEVAPLQAEPASYPVLPSVQQPSKLEIDRQAQAFYRDTPPCLDHHFSLRDLPVSEVRLSNNDLSTIASTLNLMGYGVVDLRNPTATPNGFSCAELPLLVIPSQSTGAMRASARVNGGSGGGNSSGFGGGSQQYGGAAAEISPLGYSDASEMDRFLVYYHPSQEQAMKKLQWLVANKLDVASAQVYIETMVLEVREEDSEEFGFEYSKADNDKMFTLGGLIPGGDTVDFTRDTIADAATGVSVFQPGLGKRYRLKALIDEGKAEVLSRPSVLAVSNRQATIQIVDIIQSPVLTSTLSQFGGLQVTGYNFEPLLIGITLNLKPRVSADRRWLTLEIDATVDSEDDENNGQVFAPTASGERVLLAEKQGSSSKKVRTFARIPDRTPIIIGGLVSKKVEERQGKLPLLNRIPGIGKLFTSRDDETQNREIIIVLTPYILDEQSAGINTNQPNARVRKKNSESKLFNR